MALPGRGGSISGVIVPAVCVGTAACVVAYIIWGPEQFFRKRGLCCGLVNLGNTCFVNTILQALATLPRVKCWLEDAVIHHKGRLGIALRDILKALGEDKSGHNYSSTEVLRALAVHCWRIDHQQQDAHELYHVLLNTLEEERISCLSLSDIVELQMNKDLGSHIWTGSGSVSAPIKPLSCPLRGMLTSNLHCLRCSNSLPVKYECFDSISLTLPEYKCTLENCLLEFFKSEIVYNVDCPHCSKSLGVPSVKQTFVKKLHLGRAPSCLCIHFNRSLWSSGGFLLKSDLHLTFPVSLDASKLLRREGNSAGVRYLLHAVVEHKGGPNSGHYLTYRRCGTQNKWACTSDANVYSVTVSEVLKAEAYMLFYSRIKSS